MEPTTKKICFPRIQINTERMNEEMEAMLKSPKFQENLENAREAGKKILAIVNQPVFTFDAEKFNEQVQAYKQTPRYKRAMSNLRQTRQKLSVLTANN